MARPMQIAQPVMNIRPYQAHGPILGHALELLVPATVTGGGRHANRIDAPAFSWGETRPRTGGATGMPMQQANRSGTRTGRGTRGMGKPSDSSRKTDLPGT